MNSLKKIAYHTVAGALLLFWSGCGGSGGSSAGAQGAADSSSGSARTGKGGSMARFVVSGDYLYTLNKREITVFDISRPDDPLPYTKDSVPWDVETLFSYGDYLYIGAQGGVYIYNKPTPSRGMELKAAYSHIRSCDPIVIENDLAYVTLNGGASCRGGSGSNLLEVLDVSDPLKPEMTRNGSGEENSKKMIDPKGPGVDGDLLFVCDGVGGLKVFDINRTENNETNVTTVDLYFNRESSLSEMNCYDLIPYRKRIVVSNGADVRQFDYSHLPMVELGRIK